MEDTITLVSRLRNVRHFSHLPPSQLLAIVTAGSIKRFAAGQTIFCEDEPCSGMFVLLRGKVHLCQLGPQGQMNIVSVLTPVIMFNEVAVLDGGSNPLTAMAAEDCLLWQIGYTAFQDLLEKIPQVGLSLLKVLATRNRQMIAHYQNLSFRSVTARTAKLVLDLSQRGSRPIDRRHCSIEEMARRIATVPEAISRSLKVLKSQGCIRLNGTEIVILDVEGLARLAQLEPLKMK